MKYHTNPRDPPLTSFRPNVTVGTLSLAVRLPLLGRARDLHPLDYAHVGRTRRSDKLSICLSLLLCVRIVSTLVLLSCLNHQNKELDWLPSEARIILFP